MTEYGHQAVVWQTAINPVIALELLATGVWSGAGVLGPEAFDPVPFLDKLGRIRLTVGDARAGDLISAVAPRAVRAAIAVCAGWVDGVGIRTRGSQLDPPEHDWPAGAWCSARCSARRWRSWMARSSMSRCRTSATICNAGISGLQWTVNAYLLPLAAFVLLGGALGDRFGRKRMFLLGVVWFTIASVLCGLAPSVGLLIVARALQGFGSALLTPGSLALIQSSLHPDDRARAIGIWAGLGGVASAGAALFGGYIIDTLNWRWIFFINVPLALVTILFTMRFVPESEDEGKRSEPFDMLGAVFCGLGLGVLTFALVQDMLWLAPLGLLILVGFVLWERHFVDPMTPPWLFRSVTFSVINGVTFLVYGAVGGFFFFFALQLQIVSGFSAFAGRSRHLADDHPAAARIIPRRCAGQAHRGTPAIDHRCGDCRGRRGSAGTRRSGRELLARRIRPGHPHRHRHDHAGGAVDGIGAGGGAAGVHRSRQWRQQRRGAVGQSARGCRVAADRRAHRGDVQRTG